jgi:hypothetical protein
VNVESSAPGYDCELERESGEARVPWSREIAEWVPDAFVEKLLSVNIISRFRMTVGSLL